MAVGKRKRFEIFKRDGFRCLYCGMTPPTVVLQCDHIIPVSNGGVDDASNLATSCESCNQGKSNIPLGQVTESLSAIQERQVELQEQAEAYNSFMKKARAKETKAINQLGRLWFDTIHGGQANLIFGPGRIPSIRTFLKKLPYHEVEEAIEIALSRTNHSTSYDDHSWKYFCGVCWRKIREREGK